MKKKKFKPVELKSDFKDRIASICLDIPVEKVILNRNARINAARLRGWQKLKRIREGKK